MLVISFWASGECTTYLHTFSACSAMAAFISGFPLLAVRYSFPA
jgi:hypothetical protein